MPNRSKKTARAYHPHNGRRDVPANFAAFGQSQNVEQVQGFLIDRETGQKFKGTPLVQPDNDRGFWVIQFLLKDQIKDFSHRFFLEIREDLGHGDMDVLLDVRGDITLKAVGRQLTMSYPQNGDTVCTQFTAYGTTDNAAGTITMALSPNPGLQYNRVDPNTQNWVVSCSTQPTPPGATATLTATQDSSSQSATGLKITDCNVGG